jgi:hypothetical protein
MVQKSSTNCLKKTHDYRMNAKMLNRFIHPESISAFRPILREWVEVNRSLARLWEWKDCPWWCNERASVSTLAAAIWRAGGRALEEFYDEKMYRRAKYQGRCDLYFEFQGYEFIAETKQVWLPVGRRSDLWDTTLEKSIATACKDVRHTQEQGWTRLGIVFAAPYFPKSDSDYATELLKKWQSRILDGPWDGLAWVFPPRTRYLQWTDSCIYPGVAAILCKTNE